MDIKITDGNKHIFISALNRLREEKINELNEIEVLLKQVYSKDIPNNNRIEQFTVSPSVPVNTILEDGYDIDWTWIQKVEFILEKYGKSTTANIVAKVLSYEPALVRSKVLGSISAVLSARSKEGGIFTRSENNRKENVYDLRSIEIIKNQAELNLLLG